MLQLPLLIDNPNYCRFMSRCIKKVSRKFKTTINLEAAKRGSIYHVKFHCHDMIDVQALSGKLFTYFVLQKNYVLNL
jgi:hypothetical protein